MNEYSKTLERQFQNLDIPSVHLFYEAIYYRILEYLPKNYGQILEVGAGAGGSVKFLSHLNVLRTDYVISIPGRVTGGINVENLPYETDSFAGVIAFDLIHHLNNPEKGLLEILRVLKPDHFLVIVEPYVSPLSYLTYKFFHEEDVSIYINPKKLKSKVDTQAATGNQTIMQSLLRTDLVRSSIKKKEISIIQREIFAPFSFYATGGINNPLPVPASLISQLLRLESKLPKLILKFAASRQIVIIQKY